MRRIRYWLLSCMCLLMTAPFAASAQTKLDPARLDQLMAPIALYPDALLSQILMAATYPDNVAEAAKWSAAHSSLTGDAAVKAVSAESWDPSVKSLVAFPSVMDLMGRQPAWVTSVGDAFLAEPNAVMDSVQRLRKQAKAAGNLKTTEQQKVVTQTTGDKTVVVIEPANPQVVYVPAYNPTVIYGTWPYPSYPPYYYPPPAGSVFATALVGGIGFGLGVAAVDSMWGGFNWGHSDVDINVNRYNNINVNNRINGHNGNVAWQHNPAYRGNTPYADPGTRNRFDNQRQAGTRPAPAPNSREAERTRAAQSFEGRTGQAIPGYGSPGGHNAAAAGNRSEMGNRAQTANRPQTGSHPQAGNRQEGANNFNAADRQRADQAAARDRSRASNAGSAFHGAGDGDQMRRESQRGNLDRGGERPHAEGGGRAGGGFGHGRR